MTLGILVLSVTWLFTVYQLHMVITNNSSIVYSIALVEFLTLCRDISGFFRNVSVGRLIVANASSKSYYLGMVELAKVL